VAGDRHQTADPRASTVRAVIPQAFGAAIFRAHFALGKDIGDWSVIAGCADEADRLVRLQARDDIGRGGQRLRFAEALAAEHHISGTPSWLVGDRVIVGLRPRAFFIALSRTLTSRSRPGHSSTDRTA
jgi:predicted DsbA family dithiol-disulfide isomerase